jgi:hypothetical protein
MGCTPKLNSSDSSPASHGELVTVEDDQEEGCADLFEPRWGARTLWLCTPIISAQIWKATTKVGYLSQSGHPIEQLLLILVSYPLLSPGYWYPTLRLHSQGSSIE